MELLHLPLDLQKMIISRLGPYRIIYGLTCHHNFRLCRQVVITKIHKLLTDRLNYSFIKNLDAFPKNADFR